MTQPAITIDYLANRPELAERLARWSWNEWQWVYNQRGQTFDHALKNYQERSNRDCLPLALVALDKDNGEIIGTVSLKPNDLEIRLAMTPCLGGMFVPPEWRRRGVASLLVRRAVEEAARLKLPILYLWTDSPGAEALYLKLGWTVIERMEYGGKPIVAMKIEVGG